SIAAVKGTDVFDRASLTSVCWLLLVRNFIIKPQLHLASSDRDEILERKTLAGWCKPGQLICERLTRKRYTVIITCVDTVRHLVFHVSDERPGLLFSVIRVSERRVRLPASVPDRD